MIVYLLIHACLLFTYLFLANLNMEIFFSPSHDMAEDMGSGGKLLGEQDSFSGDMDSYWRK